MTIKIQCSCGAKYSFEVEPLEGRMPFAVQCPTCNADGTEMGNRFIADATGKPRLHVQATAPAAVPYGGEQLQPARPIPVANAAMEKLRQEEHQFRTVAWIAGAVALVIAAILGVWGWYAWVGSSPRLNYSVKVPGPGAGWRAGFLDAGVILLASANHATAHNLKTGKDLWSVSLSDKETGQSASPPIYVSKDSIWICLGNRVVRLDRATGEKKQSIPIEGQLQSFTPSAESLLVVSAMDETTRRACRIDLASGAASAETIEVPKAEKQAMPNELPAIVQPTAGVLLSQALEEQKFNKPLDAVSSEFFSTGANLAELQVRLLEPKVTYVQSIKPRGPTHITSSLRASSSAADVAEEVFNDIKRDQAGGVKGIDESRYEVLLRRWAGATPAEWKGEVTGAPMFFSLETVDLLVAGRQLIAFDKENRKLFDARLAYPVNSRYSAENWDRRSVPAVERSNTLCFFDEGVMTAFSLPTGDVRWRLTSVGISKAQFDDHGLLYVDSTTGSPEDIQYSDQIRLDKVAPVLLKIDPSSGKILWQVANEGQGCFLSGRFLYTASAQQGGVAMANGLAEALGTPQADAPVHFHIYRLDPADGKVLWDFYRQEAPSELSFQQNRFLLRFGSEVQVWKFLTF